MRAWREHIGSSIFSPGESALAGELCVSVSQALSHQPMCEGNVEEFLARCRSRRARQASWSVRGAITITGVHVSRERLRLEERVHRGRPVRDFFARAGASASHAGWPVALHHIVECTAGFESTTGDVRHANESLKWTSADIVEVIVVGWLASAAANQHVLAGEQSLAA